MSTRPGRFQWLLAILVAILLSHAVLFELGLERLHRLVFAVGMVMIGQVVGGSRKKGLATFLFAAPAVVAQVVAYGQPSQGTILAAGALTFLLLAFVLWLVATSVFSDGRVSTDRILGAICVYLLLGMIWSTLHIVLWGVAPGAYDVSREIPLRSAETEFIYFSFVTLTTLGYGDVVPVSPLARMLAWTEALVGQLFLAVTIARLVGLHVAHRHSDGVPHDSV